MKKKNLLSAQATTYGGTLILQQILEILSVIQQAVDGIDFLLSVSHVEITQPDRTTLSPDALARQ